ncbi:MAG: hypothetical protein KF850_34470 [Labilithrix sp.]|nr:hypothetical protein [Labilithrix sp.]MBX3217186.1 hypothetical protein [Labilithrix sp.]
MASVVSPAPSAEPAKEVRYDLTIDEVRQNTRLNTPALVAEVFGQARAIVAEEAARSTRLDAKANTLLAVVGLIGAFVVFLYRTDPLPWAMQAFVALGALLALSSLICAVLALRITAHARIPDTALFNAEVLDRADEKDAEGVAEYQRYILSALWTSHQRTSQVNDAKASWVRRGQGLFVMAVAVPTVGSVVLLVLAR